VTLWDDTHAVETQWVDVHAVETKSGMTCTL
jgi:hypothetical protein